MKMTIHDKIDNLKAGYILNNDKPMKYPVIITGTSRGGTSMMAVAARCFGIDMGKNLGPNQENNIFHNCFYPEFNEEKLINAVKSHNDEYSQWGFKLPKAALFLDEIQNAIPDASYIFVYRNPLSCALSEFYRGGNLLNALNFSLDFFKKMSEFARTSNSKILLCSYEQSTITVDEFLKLTSQFFDKELTESISEQAKIVITGNGGGYAKF